LAIQPAATWATTDPSPMPAIRASWWEHMRGGRSDVPGIESYRLPGVDEQGGFFRGLPGTVGWVPDPTSPSASMPVPLVNMPRPRCRMARQRFGLLQSSGAFRGRPGGNTNTPGGFEGRGAFGKRWRASAVQDAGATLGGAGAATWRRRISRGAG
jgi:hypothetical protein